MELSPARLEKTLASAEVQLFRSSINSSGVLLFGTSLFACNMSSHFLRFHPLLHLQRSNTQLLQPQWPQKFCQQHYQRHNISLPGNTWQNSTVHSRQQYYTNAVSSVFSRTPSFLYPYSSAYEQRNSAHLSPWKNPSCLLSKGCQPSTHSSLPDTLFYKGL